MDIMELGAIGELVGGVAVIASLRRSVATSRFQLEGVYSLPPLVHDTPGVSKTARAAFRPFNHPELA